MSTAIWWVRRDLRLSDNQALAAAQERAGNVIPVFVLDPVLLHAGDAGEKRVAFMLEGLRKLDIDLQARGSRLIVRYGDPLEQLADLLRNTGAESIHAEEDPWPYGRSRDKRVASDLPLHLTGGLTLHPPALVHKRDGSPYTVFTPFSRTWRALPLPQMGDLLAAPERLPAVPDLDSDPIPRQPCLGPNTFFVPGEEAARQQLLNFMTPEGPTIYLYDDARDRLDLAGTSQLSPYLRFGMLSARQAVVHALDAADKVANGVAGKATRKGTDTWLSELIWREFYMAILYHFPDVLVQSFRPKLRAIEWENDGEVFNAWCEGRTGYPVVDAAMRHLVQTGWLHNRARMVVASFLFTHIKGLLTSQGGEVDWFKLFLVPTGMAFVGIVLMAFFFRPPTRGPKKAATIDDEATADIDHATP